MADRLRIVRARWPQRPVVLSDLSTATVFPRRDSWKVTLGQVARISVDQGGRYGGSKTVDEQLPNATVSVELIIQAGTADATLDAASAVVAATQMPGADALLEWRPDGSSSSLFFELRSSARYDFGYSWAMFAGAAALVLPLAWDVGPVALGDNADVGDTFDGDSITAGDWAVDTGGGTLSVLTGQLTPSSTALKRLHWNAHGYTWRNALAQIWFKAGALTTWDVAVGICVNAANDDGLYVRLSGTSLSISKRIAGVWTSLGSNIITATANADYYLRICREGQRVGVYCFYPYRPNLHSSNDNVAGGNPGQTSVSGIINLSNADAARLVAGQAGIVWTPSGTDERINEFFWEPCTYALDQEPGAVVNVEACPGDVPPRVDVSYASPLANHQYGVFAWWRQPRIHSLLWNGAGQYLAANFTRGEKTWSTAVLGSLNAAGTSVDGRFQNRKSKWGRYHFQAVTTAVADSGVVHDLATGASKRKHYVAAVWVAGASGSAKLRTGATLGSDFVTSPALTLSATWQLASVVWSPSADRNAGAAILSGGVAITTIDYDGPIFFEVPLLTDLSASALIGATTLLIRGGAPAEWPEAPFYAIMPNAAGASEIVRVLSYTPGVAAITVARGQLGTVAFAPGAAQLILPLPESETHLAGNGITGEGAFGYIDFDSVAQLSGSIGSVVHSVDAATQPAARFGAPSDHGSATFTIPNASAGSNVGTFRVDPALYDPDPFAESIEVEVYLRFLSVAAAVNSPRFRAWMNTIPNGSSSSANNRWSREFGAGGVPVYRGAGGVERTNFVGTFVLPVRKDSSPLTLYVEFSWGVASNTGAVSFDFDSVLILPARTRASMPEGRATDTSYPYFFGNSFKEKLFTFDRRGFGAQPDAYDGHQPWRDLLQDVGLGGSRIEPAWQRKGGQFMVRTGAFAPSDPVAAGAGDGESSYRTVHLAIQPRWTLYRGASE